MKTASGLILGLVISSVSHAGDPSTLKGTWVRETIVAGQAANQVVATFTDSRLTVVVRSGALKPHGETVFMSVTMSGEYAVTKSGIVCAVVSRFDIDVNSLPKGDDFVDSISPAIFEMSGHPVCFRATIDNGVMLVSEIKIPNLAMVATCDRENGAKTVLAMVAGAYKSSKTETVPFPKRTVGEGTAAAPKDGFPPMRERVEITPLPAGSDLQHGPSRLMLPGDQKFPVPTVCPEVPTARTPASLPSHGVLSSPKRDQMNSMPFMALMPVSGMEAPTPIPMTVPPSRLEGTWYREMILPGIGGGQVIMSFQNDRLRIKFVEFGYGDGTGEKSGAYECNCTYFYGPDSYVVGRCLGIDIDVKEVPANEMLKGKQTGFFGGSRQAEGEPFSFRCEWRNGELFVSDMRIKLPEKGSSDKYAKDLMTALTSGRYRTAVSEVIPLPKLGPKKEMTKAQTMPLQQTAGYESILPPSNVEQRNPPVVPSGTISPRMLQPSPVFPQGVATPLKLPPAGTYRTEPIPESLRKQWEESTRPARPADPARMNRPGSPSRE
jgi:hypothetical protein